MFHVFGSLFATLNTGDSYQDLEVEFNADGTIAGYVVGGLGFCPDTVRLSTRKHFFLE